MRGDLAKRYFAPFFANAGGTGGQAAVGAAPTPTNGMLRHAQEQDY